MTTTTHPNQIIGQNLRALREKIGLTQEALAQYLGISREQVSYFEIGQRSIPSPLMRKLADLFCMEEYDFYEEDLHARNISIAFAFRADAVLPEDLQQIAHFKKIVRNYLNMKKVLANE